MLCSQVYERVGDLFRERYGPHAGWAHSLLFAAELPAFRSRLPAAVQEEMAAWRDEEKRRKEAQKRSKAEAAAGKAGAGKAAGGSTAAPAIAAQKGRKATASRAPAERAESGGGAKRQRRAGGAAAEDEAANRPNLGARGTRRSRATKSEARIVD